MMLRLLMSFALLSAFTCLADQAKQVFQQKKPNILFVFADQWRAAATGYAGDPNVKTPNLDRLARESVNVTNAVSGCPVCCPYRASLLTGQRPTTHGVFLNDVSLDPHATTIAKVLKQAGYNTAYVGKWHLDGHGRSAFIPRERRQGFDYWKVLECTHNYQRSAFYADTEQKNWWGGYDAIAQTRDVQDYLRSNAKSDKPFFLMLSWGPPHNPYESAPERFRKMYSPDKIKLRPNVPSAEEQKTRKDLAGYYAHCSALDYCMGELWQTLKDTKLEQNTIFVFTSDHGDMLGSQGEIRKQRPWDESIRVPLLFHFPAKLGLDGKSSPALINAEDLMPTLLGFCNISVPKTVEGHDYSTYLMGLQNDLPEAALLMSVSPFGEWTRASGGREYRGIRTQRYTYVRDLKGPWLLYDNQNDPYQLTNLCNAAAHAGAQAKLQALLEGKLQETGDKFLPGSNYIQSWGYKVDSRGTVPYAH